jgi:hypothetical protein
MTKTTEHTDSRTSNEPPKYEPPRVVESAPFETLALSCGKTPGDPGTECYDDPGTS